MILRGPPNSFVPYAPFPYPLKKSENLTVFLCFQGVEKECIGNEWVKLKRGAFSPYGPTWFELLSLAKDVVQNTKMSLILHNLDHIRLKKI